jgi:hypothetical protein
VNSVGTLLQAKTVWLDDTDVVSICNRPPNNNETWTYLPLPSLSCRTHTSSNPVSEVRVYDEDEGHQDADRERSMP